ncbi:hypothetical protein Fuma_03227 [Fuerstiella marisgermanici]|uniref:Uncharacterized protein n=1 Tax=Fuerstiella marisgermanici TaxID=1891926 RepID=A0A1P8WHS1_9PLAN|nr:hypothetical protein Fuma_03227 [Fuerstiella marisgermanici]
MDVGKTAIETVVIPCQLFVIEAEQLQNYRIAVSHRCGIDGELGMRKFRYVSSRIRCVFRNRFRRAFWLSRFMSHNPLSVIPATAAIRQIANT